MQSFRAAGGAAVDDDRRRRDALAADLDGLRGETLRASAAWRLAARALHNRVVTRLAHGELVSSLSRFKRAQLMAAIEGEFKATRQFEGLTAELKRKMVHLLAQTQGAGASRVATADVLLAKRVAVVQHVCALMDRERARLSDCVTKLQWLLKDSMVAENAVLGVEERRLVWRALLSVDGDEDGEGEAADEFQAAHGGELLAVGLEEEEWMSGRVFELLSRALHAYDDHSMQLRAERLVKALVRLEGGEEAYWPAYDEHRDAEAEEHEDGKPRARLPGALHSAMFGTAYSPATTRLALACGLAPCLLAEQGAEADFSVSRFQCFLDRCHRFGIGIEVLIEADLRSVEERQNEAEPKPEEQQEEEAPSQPPAVPPLKVDLALLRAQTYRHRRDAAFFEYVLSIVTDLVPECASQIRHLLKTDQATPVLSVGGEAPVCLTQRIAEFWLGTVLDRLFVGLVPHDVMRFLVDCVLMSNFDLLGGLAAVLVLLVRRPLVEFLDSVVQQVMFKHRTQGEEAREEPEAFQHLFARLDWEDLFVQFDAAVSAVSLQLRPRDFMFYLPRLKHPQHVRNLLLFRRARVSTSLLSARRRSLRSVAVGVRYWIRYLHGLESLVRERSKLAHVTMRLNQARGFQYHKLPRAGEELAGGARGGLVFALHGFAFELEVPDDLDEMILSMSLAEVSEFLMSFSDANKEQVASFRAHSELQHIDGAEDVLLATLKTLLRFRGRVTAEAVGDEEDVDEDEDDEEEENGDSMSDEANRPPAERPFPSVDAQGFDAAIRQVNGRLLSNLAYLRRAQGSIPPHTVRENSLVNSLIAGVAAFRLLAQESQEVAALPEITFVDPRLDSRQEQRGEEEEEEDGSSSNGSKD